jgi:hypothetical protein
LSQYVAIQWRADPSEGLHQVRQALGPRHGIEVVMELPHSTFCRLTNVPPFQVQGLLDELRALSHVQQVASLRSFELARSLEDE